MPGVRAPLKLPNSIMRQIISPDLFAVLQKISTKRFNLKRNK